VKILLVSGFLGAGKTTFIRHLAEKTGKRFVVLENEFGEAGIDRELLIANNEDAFSPDAVWELAEGCICCSMKGDFAASVLTIANALNPEILVVEPTGLGLLGNIVANLRKIQYERIILLAPVTLVDARLLERGMAEHPQIFADQIRSASRILLSKAEGLSPGERQNKANLLRELNPHAMIQTSPYQDNPEDWWQGLFGDSHGQPLVSEEMDVPPPDFESAGFTDASFPSGAHLLCFLQNVVAGAFGGIYRAKGVVAVGKGAALRFDVVCGRYSVTGAANERIHKTVFIGQNLKRELLRKSFSRMPLTC
jgi:G3E family GTPase